MVRGWTMVCAGMILTGQQLSPEWLHAGDPSAQTARAAEFGQAAPDNSVPGDLRPLLAAPPVGPSAAAVPTPTVSTAGVAITIAATVLRTR